MTGARTLGVVALAVVAACCGDESTDTGTGPTAVTFTTTQFSNVVDPGARRFYSFSLATSGPVTVTLASVTNADSGAPLPIPMRVGVGRPQGTECAAATAASVTAALQSQLTHLAPQGINCIDVAELGQAAGPVRFAIRFTHP